MISVQKNSTRLMLYAMTCTLIVAFGAIGSILVGKFGEQYTLMGLFLGSALGAFISVYESTIVGSIIGMLLGVVSAPLVLYFVDLETACLLAFTMSLLGAIMGEPLASFWREGAHEEEGYRSDEH
jgi:hypothetical protein